MVNQDFIRADQEHVWHGWSPVHRRLPMFVRGHGSYVWDAHGKRYIDAVSSSMNSVCGYGNQRLIEAARLQMSKLHHFDHSMVATPPAAKLARRMAALMPGRLSRTVFTNSGSEAVEAAIRIALDYWSNIGEQRSRVITFAAGYHGCTLLTRKLNGQLLSRSGRDLGIDIDRIGLPVNARMLREPDGAKHLLQSFRETFENHPKQTALVLVEPFLNVGGGIVLPGGFLHGLQQLCNSDGALLCIDEVFTGFGRTGRMFCLEHENVLPDLAVVGKGMASGYIPLAGVIARENIHNAFQHDPLFGGLCYGHTTSGHATACAVASEVLDIIAEERLIERAQAHGQRMLNALSTCSNVTGVTDVRGIGMVSVVEFENPTLAAAAAGRAFEAGLLLRQQASSLLALPALSATTSLVDDVVQIFCDSIRHAPALITHCAPPRTAQQRSRINQGVVSNPIGLAFKVEGTLDIKRLRGAIQAVVAHHDALHVMPFESTRRLCKDVAEQWLPPLELGGDPVADREMMRAALRGALGVGVDLIAGPLMRLTVFGDDSNVQLIMLVTDHILLDGLSMRPLQKDLEACFAGGQLSERSHSYESFAVHQRELLSGNYGHAARAYWLGKFEEFQAYPPDFSLAEKLVPHPPAGCVRFARRIAPEVFARLKTQAVARGVGMFALTASAILSAAARVGRPPSGLVTDTHGRISPEAMDVVGLFSHGMPIYCDSNLYGDRESVLECVRKELAYASDHAMPLRGLSEEYKRNKELETKRLEPFLYFADASHWEREMKLGNARLSPMRIYGPHDPRPGKGADMLSIQVEYEDGLAWLTVQGSPFVNPPSRLDELLSCALEEIACFSA